MAQQCAQHRGSECLGPPKAKETMKLYLYCEKIAFFCTVLLLLVTLATNVFSVATISVGLKTILFLKIIACTLGG